MKLTKELLEKAKAAGSVEELKKIARAGGVELTAEEAEKAFAELHKGGELADEELDGVSGGCGDPDGPAYCDVGMADSPAQVVHLFSIGQTVRTMSVHDGPVPCRVKELLVWEAKKGGSNWGYCPAYVLEETEDSPSNPGTIYREAQDGILKD